MNGGYLAVSSIGDRTMGFMAGAVHIFLRDNGTWEISSDFTTGFC